MNPPDSIQRRLLPAAGLVLLVIAAFAPALVCGFVWDDELWVTANPTLLSLAGLKRIWLEPWFNPQCYPLACTTFWLEHAAWGFHPFGYHLDNLLLHAANAVLAWQVFLRLNLNRSAAWLAAALFAVHPIEVESVAWVCERKNGLSGFFFLAATLVWVRFEGTNSRRQYACAFLLFLAALLSKTVTCSLPAVLLILAWLRRGRITYREVAALIPFFVTGAGLALATTWFEHRHLVTIGPEWNFSPADRLLIAGRALWFYPVKLLWPQPIAFVYPRWQIDSGLWWQWLFPVAAFLLVASLWRGRARLGRTPLAAVVMYGAMLFPALGFVNVYPMRYSFVADHFQYLAGLPLLALAGMGLSLAPSRIRSVAVPCLLFTAILLSAFQCRAYRSLETLWRDTLAKNPEAVLAWNNLALICMDDGRAGEAIRCMANAVRLAPNDFEVQTNAGVLMAKLGRTDAAIAHYRLAIRGRPEFATSHNNLGSALASQGRLAEAIAEFETAVRLAPVRAGVHGNLGGALLHAGRAEEAIAQLRVALRLDPTFREARENLLIALRKTGRTDEAAAVERSY